MRGREGVKHVRGKRGEQRCVRGRGRDRRVCEGESRGCVRGRADDV